jgi:catechol-2,3-dioxygenase
MSNASWRLGEVSLKVLDLDVQIGFYQNFGLALLSREGDVATLGAGGPRWSGLPEGTVLGHMHVNVADPDGIQVVPLGKLVPTAAQASK